MNHSLPLSDYLTRILTASVYDVAVETPLDLARSLSGRLNNQVLLKREDLQPVFSFKIRGAYNKMAKLPKEALDCGVIAASGQPCAGCGFIGAVFGLPRRHRDAGNNA